MLGHLDAYEKSRLRKLPELGTTLAHRETELNLPGKEVNLAGKTGYVFGLNGEATRVTLKTPTGKRHYSFVAMVQNNRVKTKPNASELDWIPPTSGAIREIFKRVHHHMSSN